MLFISVSSTMLFTSVALMFWTSSAASSAWGGQLQNVTAKTSTGAWELHSYPTPAGTWQNANDASGHSPEGTTDTLDSEAANACLEGNNGEPGNVTASGETCTASDEEVATIRSVESYWTYIVGMGINRYILPVIVVVGVFGNLVSMTIMFQRQNRQSSFSVYLGSLAMSDTCVLLGSAYYWVIIEIQRRTFSDIECKLLMWALNTFQQNGFYLILSVTLDRVVAVRFPFRAAGWCRARRATIVSVAVFTAISTYNIPNLVFTKSDNVLMCMLCSFEHVVCIVGVLGTMVIMFAIPVVLLLSMNAVIIHAVYNSMKYRPGHSTDSDRHTSNIESIEVDEISTAQSCQSVSIQSVRRNRKELSPQDRNLISTLLIVSFTFLLLNAPPVARVVMSYVIPIERTPRNLAFDFLTFHIMNKLYFLNNACNFFLYCLSGSKFRRDFVTLFPEHFSRRCHDRSVDGTSRDTQNIS